MKTSELSYELPEDLIAQTPADRRDASRLLVLNRADGSMQGDVYRNVAQYLRAGDCMVLNRTRVIRARLKGRKASGGQVEIFLLAERSPGCWEALVRPSAKVKFGAVVRIGDAIRATVGAVLPEGRREVRFDHADVLGELERVGEVPLPPYIKRDHAVPTDSERYQTIYADQPGAVAAPTAGLHFTPEVFASLDAAGIARASLVLHVGYGTFKPIQVDDVADHHLEPEEFDFPEETARLLDETRAGGHRVVAVGTTTTRVLETQYRDGRYLPGQGRTGHYIYPPYTFKAVDVLQTNFHLPCSSLLALVCAFAGTEFVLEAYRYAVRERYRFYSYGDVMLIL